MPTFDTRDAFIEALDKQQPEWWISFAEITELREAIHTLNYDSMDMDRSDNEIAISFERQRGILKRRVAERLMAPVRACVHAGLVIPREGF